jgi:Fe-S cluster assembly protein SufB
VDVGNLSHFKIEEKMSKYTEDDLEQELKTQEYKYGFYTDIESETFAKGLNEDVVRAISKKKNEPEWMN